MDDAKTEERPSIAQLAADEAARAEAGDTAETDAAAEPEPEPETDAAAEPDAEPEPDVEPASAAAEPEPGPSPAEAEMYAELERAQTAYAKRVRKALPEGAPLVECDKCNGIGFDLTGGQEQPVFPPHERFARCAHCDGHGMVDTGSKRAEAAALPCPTCSGNGYIDRMTFQPPSMRPGDPPQLVDTAGRPPGWEPWMGDPRQTVAG